MFEKILIPMDGSELAELALPYAEEMIGRLGSELTLLHINQGAEDPYSHIYQAYFEKVADNTRRGIERYLRKDEGRAVKLDTIILDGHPAEQIIDYTDSQGIDLIIMATHGRSGIRRWTVGSVADKVIRVTKQPVLLIRAGSPRPRVLDRGMLKKVLVPLDSSEISEAIIPYVEELAQRLDLELFLLMVQESKYYIPSKNAIYPDEYFKSTEEVAKGYLDKVSTQLSLKGISVKSDVLTGAAAEQILVFADQIDADVIAMATHGRSGVSRWALGSVAENVLHEGTLPLLLIRA